MHLSLQRASLRDLGFVMSLAQNGARHGHFDPRITSEKGAYLRYLQSAVSIGRDPRGFETRVSIILLNTQRIGATVVTEAIGTPDVGVEIAMISVKPEYRGKGLGAKVLDLLIDQYLSSMSVCARCLPASRTLHEMLLRRDFSEVGLSQQSVILRHPAVHGFSSRPLVPMPQAQPAIST